MYPLQLKQPATSYLAAMTLPAASILVLFLPSPYNPFIYLLSLLGLYFLPYYSTGRFRNGFMNWIYRDKEPAPASHLYIKDQLTLRINPEGSWGRFLLFISLWCFFFSLSSLKCAFGSSCKETPLTSMVQMKLHFDTEFDSVVSFEECMFEEKSTGASCSFSKDLTEWLWTKEIFFNQESCRNLCNLHFSQLALWSRNSVPWSWM